MSITYTWKVTGIRTRREGLNNDVVTQTYWEKIGTDLLGNTAAFSGATPFTATTMPEGNIFIPIDQLTEEVVLRWIKDSIPEGSAYDQHINDSILKQLENISNPLTETPMPWVVAPQEPNV